MKVVILCGGMGTRLAEETTVRPKPMVNIGGHPILWHIMNIYASYGFSDFALALGYKGEDIKSYFLNWHELNSDFKINLGNGQIERLRAPKKDWSVELIDTGAETLTGGRVKRLEAALRPHGTFMVTYGDGVANVDIKKLLAFHKSHGKLATVTTVRPPARFGGIEFDGNLVKEFKEKPQAGEGWINGGFFIFEPSVFDYLRQGDQTILEREPLEALVADKQLVGYQHNDFWQCMDTIRDKQLLEDLWINKKAPWKIWE